MKERPTKERLTLAEQLKLANWIKNSWQSVIVQQKWTIKQACAAASAMVGKPVSTWLFRKLLAESMPGVSFAHSERYPGGPTQAMAKREELEKRIAALEAAVAALQSKANLGKAPPWNTMEPPVRWKGEGDDSTS